MFDRIWKTVKRVIAVATVEIYRILRDRTSFSLVVLVPALQVILFGYAINLDAKNVRLAVAGGTPSAQIRIVEAADKSGYFNDVIQSITSGEAKFLLESGNVDVAIELADASRIFDELENDEVTASGNTNSDVITNVYADGANVNAIAPALAALERSLFLQVMNKSAPESAVISGYESIRRIWLYNPEMHTSWTILPALMGVIVMISMLLLGALTLVREREQGTWEALMIMPVGKFEVLAGKLAPYLIIALIQLLLALAACHILFQLPVVGSLMLFLVGGLILSFAHLVLGFVISACVSSQLQALQSAVAFYLPSMLLSGFMFPFSGMPEWAQYIGNVLPLTHFVRFSRNILLKGAEVNDVYLNLLPILTFTAIIMLCVIPLYRRRLI
ncbi:ABC transporter permease [Kordiimonas aquimaris]|uniref:ABC transporter permease n=1 Tax=Kordiimonas aquimaris TaxID=707591 RepID=UPI0021CF50FB|nr:ABC transporter permease [Kordiimonas aquimaris]